MKFKKRYVILPVLSALIIRFLVMTLYIIPRLPSQGDLYLNMGDYEKAERYYLVMKILIENSQNFTGKEDPSYALALIRLGWLYDEMGKYEDAESYLLKAKAIYEKSPDKEYPSYAWVLTILGVQYWKMGDSDKAENCFLEAKTVYEKNPGKEHPLYAYLLTILGALYEKIGDNGKAESYYLEAKTVKKKALDKKNQDYAASLHNLGWPYFLIGNYVKVQYYLIEAKAIREKRLEEEYLDYADSLTILGALYEKIGDNNEAENNYLEAKAVYEKNTGKKHPEYATSLTTLGWLYQGMAYYGKAESYYLEAKAIYEKNPGKEQLNYAWVLTTLGSVYEEIGYNDDAKSNYLKAKAVYEENPGKEHPVYAALLTILGELHEKTGDNNEAENNYLEAKAVYEKNPGKEHPDYAASLTKLGWLYQSMGYYDKAESYYLEAKAVYEKNPGKEHPNYAWVLTTLGAVYSEMGDSGKAENCFLEMKAILERALDKEYSDYALGLSSVTKSVYQIYMGDYTKAGSYLPEIKAIVERRLGTQNPDFITSLDYLYGMYFFMKDYKQALALKKEANQLNKNLINRVFSSLSEKERETYWNRRSSSFEANYSLSEFHSDPESHALNYDTALFSKGLLLRTTNTIRDSIYSSGDQFLIKQYKDFLSLRRQIGALRQREDGKEEDILELERQADELDKSITQASAAYMTANKELKADLALGWEDVRDSLQAGEAAIEFVSFNLFNGEWTGKIIYAALVLRHGIETPAYVSLFEETDLAELFKKLAGKDPREQARILYEENGTGLYALVWQPLEKILEGAKTVYYSPSGLLHKLSFNAIPIKGDLPLSSVYDLNLVSSTREIARLKSNTAEKPRSAALYGGLVYDIDADKMKLEAKPYNSQGVQISSVLPDGIKRGGSLPFLAGSSRECLSIQQRFIANKIPTDLYDGEKGNEESFKNLDRKKTGVIHLATHGFFREDIERNYEGMERLERLGGGKNALENPLMRSYLALAGAQNALDNKAVEGVEDGLLFAGEIANINLLGTELVVLSACDTALGVVNNSEGVFGLQRAFKLAGAETIVMSLWKIDDNATSELMARFYGNWLSGGMGKQEAFKEAQRWLRSRKEYSSPYYWAAFVMMD